MKSRCCVPVKLQNVLKVKKFLRVLSRVLSSVLPSGNFFLRLPTGRRKRGGRGEGGKKEKEKRKKNQLTVNDPTRHEPASQLSLWKSTFTTRFRDGAVIFKS